MDSHQHLEESDKEHIWHPFTQMKEWLDEKPIIISGGKGCYLVDVDGKRYLDGVSSLWVNIHGHRKKEIDEAIKTQVDSISHSTLLGLSNVPAIKLAEKLVRLMQRSAISDQLSAEIKKTGSGMSLRPVHSQADSMAANGKFSPPPSPPWQGGEKGEVGPASPSSRLTIHDSPRKVFYSDNGSTSVEVALKMAFQYWAHKGAKEKTRFLSLDNAYHGDTLGAVSVGGIDIFHAAFGPLLFKAFKAPSPYCYRCGQDMSYPDCGLSCLSKMEEILSVHHDEIAAFIIEPLVQAAGGMIVAPPGYLKGARELCTKYNVLFIADEVATGFGRTGRMFACEHEAVVPDIICLSKGITGGYLPLAVTISTEEVYNAFLGDFRDLKTFFHGHSYTGNPLGCAAALACLDIFEKEKTLDSLPPKIAQLEDWLVQVSGLPHVGDARSRGLMAGVEIVKDKEKKEPYPWDEKMGWRICHHAREKGILIRPLGNVIIIMPPLSISSEDLGCMLDAISEAIVSVT